MMNSPLRSPKLIPLTSMRNFYEVLRRFPSYQFHLSAVRECLRVPEKLDEMIQDSVDHVAQYKNEGERFHDRGTDGAPTEACRGSKHLSNRITCRIVDRQFSLDMPKLQFDYVDYEIGPLRTTGGTKFENGKNSSSGGIDLLLTNRRDSVPIIGEVKAEKDATLFLALIQSLTYAIELMADSQRTRLQSAYPNRFKIHQDGPFVDIYLIQVRAPEDEWSERFLTAVDELASRVLKEPSAGSLLRRIVCLETPLPDDGAAEFSVRFCHEPTA